MRHQPPVCGQKAPSTAGDLIREGGVEAGKGVLQFPPAVPLTSLAAAYWISLSFLKNDSVEI